MTDGVSAATCTAAHGTACKEFFSRTSMEDMISFLHFCSKLGSHKLVPLRTCRRIQALLVNYLWLVGGVSLAEYLWLVGGLSLVEYLWLVGGLSLAGWGSISDWLVEYL